jgi:predicted amidohydrolase YtcJ
MQEIVVYTARAIHTMNPSFPVARAVAVCGERIIEVGDRESLRPWLDAHPHRFDDRLENHILMPGFIDPHIHPSMAALLLRLPWQDVTAVRGKNTFLDRLGKIESTISDPHEPLFTWGHHPIWHGEIDRETINGVSSSRPIIVWHRGFHSLFVNDAALDWMGLEHAEIERHPQIDAKSGKFYETGLALAFRSINPYLLAPDRFAHGMERLRRCVHHGGHTTIGDMAIGIFDFEMEWAQQLESLERDDTPFRVVLTPFASSMTGGDIGPERIDEIRSYRTRNTHRLKFTNHVKMFTDGGCFPVSLSSASPAGSMAAMANG